MNPNQTLSGRNDRIASIDILRGIAIFGMILCANIGWQSGLPAWMFHAQVPPPDYVFRPDIPGITWVDLVFPFFLFSMGAAFPFALDKRIRSGQPMSGIILGLVKRWAILAAFSIVLGNGYAAGSSEENRFLVYGFKVLLWGGFFLSLTRFGFNDRKLAALANLAGVAVIAGLAFAMPGILGIPLSKNRSDIIIMVLAYVALFGGLIWIISRRSLILRGGIIIAIGIVKGLTSYIPEIFSFMPSVDSIGIGWIFRWEFLQYLMVALAGSVAGDMILRRREEQKTETHLKSDVWMASLALLTAVFQLWGLYTRHVTADFMISAASAIIFLIIAFRHKALWSDITTLGYLMMLVGIAFDPIDGGITKDHCNLSYMMTTAGMAAIVTGFLICMETRFGMKARWFSECGQNPMMAYTVTNFLTAPVLSAIGLLQLIDSWAFGSPFMGIVRGLFITGLMMAVTIFFTRRKIFWRS